MRAVRGAFSRLSPVSASLLAALLAAAAVGLAAPASQAQTSEAPLTPESIERHVAQGIAAIEDGGLTNACQSFADPAGPFEQDEGYVFVLTRSGALLCHPRPDLLGVTRRSYVPDMLLAAEAAAPDGAWTRYPWPHPITGRVEEKSTFCRLLGPLVICAGAHFGGFV